MRELILVNVEHWRTENEHFGDYLDAFGERVPNNNGWLLSWPSSKSPPIAAKAAAAVANQVLWERL